MARVTQPSGDTKQAHSNSTKVARERGGTAGSKAVIHWEKK
jgi:hypothetical protein